jgi:hypothetical protein
MIPPWTETSPRTRLDDGQAVSSASGRAAQAAAGAGVQPGVRSRIESKLIINMPGLGNSDQETRLKLAAGETGRAGRESA